MKENIERILVGICLTIIGGVLSAYGFTYLFHPQHNLSPLALVFGIVSIIVGILCLTNKQDVNQEVDEP